jgi:TonB family protein
MASRGYRFLLCAAVLACTALSCPSACASEPSTCAPPKYPRQSLRLGEAGISGLGFLIRTDGTVARSVVFSSSGSPDLDQAALEALSKCIFKPATVDGTAVERWAPVLYKWTLDDDDPEWARLKRELAQAARKGELAARYHLGLVLLSTAKTDADRQRAELVLRSAAEQGHPHAQFDLGRRYEKGTGVDADTNEALRWYEKAAAQGDVFAIERLKLGKLSY